MSTSKKGKDLSALKARLAKKAAASSDGDAAPSVPAPGEVKAAVPAPGEIAKPAADVPAPGEVKPAADIPAPGEVKKPADIPAPGEVSKPADIPAPGEVRQPAPAPAPAAAPAAPQPQADIDDDPMSGGVAFDPDAGLIDDIGGEIKGKGGTGLAIFAGVIGVVLGVGLGWMGHKTSDLNARKASAVKKAESIAAKVTEIEETRSRIALKIGEAQDALEAKEGDKAVAALTELEPTYAELGDIFGWQMASMDPAVVKAVFELAEANNALQLDVGILKGWIGANKEILSKRAQGPSSFVVIINPEGGSVLAEYVAGICEDIPDPLPEDFDPAKLKKCEGDAILKANAYMVRTDIGGQTQLVPKGQAHFLNPMGAMYTYAIGANPEANAKAYFDIRMGKLKDTLDAMVKLKDDAEAGISNYTGDPQVGGD